MEGCSSGIGGNSNSCRNGGGKGDCATVKVMRTSDNEDDDAMTR